MRDRATDLLRQALGHDAEFRAGQLDALEAIVERKERLLLVQRTGWGKSVVYFLATRMLRDAGQGPALLISPLLSLMRDQKRFAERLHVRAARFDSSNREEWESVREQLAANECDLLLISPERLANSSFREEVQPLLDPGIGLFIVDEAHCISDWGHDFRPDYRRIRSILSGLPRGVPVLATTATANQRVVEDIAEQMGESFGTQRGELARASLRLQAIPLRDQAERLAWLAREVPTLEGSGIVYCITKRDCARVASWLRQHGIEARAYYAGLDDREERENELRENRVKVLVSTIALGMGFDKPDLRFVIHFQRPSSPVAYYQQVGRAGRGVPEAKAILLAGREDEEIHAYFIRTAFPDPADFEAVLRAIEGSEEGLKAGEIQSAVNIPARRLSKALNLLLVEGALEKRSGVYVRTLRAWTPDQDRWNAVNARRVDELARMRDFLQTSDCLMEFIGRELDDPGARPCGVCAQCAGPIVDPGVDEQLVRSAAEFLRHTELPIEPRKRWPSAPGRAVGGGIATEERAREGRALSVYGEAGYGALVARGKYELGRFPDELVDATFEFIGRWNPDPAPEWVTCIPSHRHPDLVPEFARRIADRLGIPFVPVLETIGEAPEQKTLENSAHQFRNVFDSLTVDSDAVRPSPVLLIDDIVDSRWTIAMASSLLGNAGCPAVFPFVLAQGGGGN
ncbi:MAG: RecQ family ATP-dependent DNA helicase [Planctomycetota bacterium]